MIMLNFAHMFIFRYLTNFQFFFGNLSATLHCVMYENNIHVSKVVLYIKMARCDPWENMCNDETGLWRLHGRSVTTATIFLNINLKE